jgi:hypothetical protein
MEVSGQLHAPAALPPGKEPLVQHWTGGWMGPRAVVDAVVKRKIPSPRRESNPRTPIVQPVAQRYTHSHLQMFFLLKSNPKFVCENKDGHSFFVCFINVSPCENGLKTVGNTNNTRRHLNIISFRCFYCR